MNKLSKAICVAGAFGALVALPTVSSAAGVLWRLASEFDYFGSEASTSSEPPGVAIYRKTVVVPAFANTLYLTLSTTGDAHNGAANCFTALLDGAFFNPGGQGAAACASGGQVPGWITLLKVPAGGTNCNDGGGGPGDCHDNGIYYQWCTPVKRGKHEVEIRMATSSAGDTVFIEQAHFYVDASRFGFKENGCGQAETPDADGGGVDALSPLEGPQQ